MRFGPADTPPAVLELMADGYRRMSPAQKLKRVLDLNETVRALATARLRRTYGADISEHELRLRLAALGLDRETMRRAFGWDPGEKGY